MKIAILDDYQEVALSLADWNSLNGDITVFTDTISGPQLIERLRPFEVICLMRERTPFPGDVINALPNLKLIVTSGMRNLSIDLEAAKARGIPVCGTANRAPSTAHHTMSLILAATGGLFREALSMRNGGWQRGVGRDLDGLTLGLIGLGKQGAQVAALARPFGMRIIAWSQNLTPERCEELGVERAVSLHNLLAEADVASIHLLLSDRSTGLIDADALSMMKTDAVLVNTSRGPIVKTSAVLRALRAGQLGAAALDVYDSEPVAPDHSMRDTDLIDNGKLILTPHTAYVTEQTLRIFYTQTVEDVAAWASGAPLRVLNP